MKDDEFDPQSQLDAAFDALMRDAARTYHAPPDLADADVDDLFARVEATLASGERPALTVVRGDIGTLRPRPRLWQNAWLRAAAVLFLGVALGRASTRVGPSAPATTTAARETRDAQSDSLGTGGDLAPADQAATNEYLGRAEALLAALPRELQARRSDPAYLSQADALLLQTRLLQDSPAAADPALRSLFDDLEVVFAQVVRLHTDRDPTRIDFLHQAMEQRDVLPRLRDAVAENAGD